MNFKKVSTLIMNFGTPFPTSSLSFFYDYELQTPFLNFNYTQRPCSEHFCDGFIFHNLTDSALLHSAHIINNNSRVLGNFENDNDRNERRGWLLGGDEKNAHTNELYWNLEFFD